MILFHAHSGLRYLALLVGVAVIVYAIRLLVKKEGHDPRLYNLAGTYRLLMDLTLFLGVALLFTGRFYPAVGTHIVIMLFATVIAHVVPLVMRKRDVEERTVMPYLVATTVSVGLVILGTVMIGRPPVG